MTRPFHANHAMVYIFYFVTMVFWPCQTQINATGDDPRQCLRALPWLHAFISQSTKLMIIFAPCSTLPMCFAMRRGVFRSTFACNSSCVQGSVHREFGVCVVLQWNCLSRSRSKTCGGENEWRTTAAAVNSRRCGNYFRSGVVESSEIVGFCPRRVLHLLFKRFSLYEKWHLEHAVVSGEANTLSGLIIASALVWKCQCHCCITISVLKAQV